MHHNSKSYIDAPIAQFSVPSTKKTNIWGKEGHIDATIVHFQVQSTKKNKEIGEGGKERRERKTLLEAICFV